MTIGFEDTVWMFSGDNGQSLQTELSLTDAATVWKCIHSTTGTILEIGRREGAMTRFLQMAGAGRKVVSVGAKPLSIVVPETRYSLADDLRLEVRCGSLFDRGENKNIGAVVIAAPAADLLLPTIAIHWSWKLGESASLMTVRVADADPEAVQQLIDLIAGAAQTVFRSNTLLVLRILSPLPAVAYFRAALQLRDKKEELSRAGELLKACIGIYPEYAEGWHEYGRTLLMLKCDADAEKVLRQAVSLKTSHHYLNNLGLALMRLGRASEAVPLFQQTLAIEPNYIHALNNLGWAFEEVGKIAESVEIHRQAVRVSAEYPQAHYNLGRSLLALGDLRNGWREYEWRWKTSSFPSRRRDQGLPEWDGRDLHGSSVLLWAEQGIGDEMAFGSMIPDFIAKGASGVLECSPKLVPVFARSFPQFEVVPRTDRPDRRILSRKLDCQISFATLGQHFRNELSDFPATAGYLQPAADKVLFWRQRFAKLSLLPKVGIAWTSKNRAPGRLRHYLTIEQLEPILRLPNCVFVCVQYGDCARDIDLARDRYGTTIHRFEDLDLFDDIDGVLAMTSALDVGVASKFSSCLDMMGVRDIPVLAFDRSLTERNLGTTGVPWYPSVKGFRCETNEPVEPTVREMANALRDWLKGRERTAND